MRRIRRLIDNEQGVALVLALMILLILTGLVLAFLSTSAFEPQISRNHSETVRARYVAEAGVEYAYDTLATNVGSWNDYLAAATCAQGAVLGAPNSSLPGLGSAHGTFTVRVRNDCKAGDVIDGRDTKIADRPGSPTGSESAVYGIAVNPSLPALAAGLETALAAGPQNDVRGKDKTNPSATTRGPNTIRADGTLTSQAVTDF